jgi:glyoxylase-like metal-dependent hydrolase (beta-lactamase superfamily II)
MFGGGDVDLYLEEGEFKTDHLVKDKLEIFHTPGHASGEISIYWPEKKALAVGDVIFFQNIGRTDFPTGDDFMLKSSIEKLSKLDVEYMLCGHPYGHPGVIQGKDNVKQKMLYY